MATARTTAPVTGVRASLKRVLDQPLTSFHLVAGSSGLLLVLGLFTRAAAAVAGLAMVAFIVGISWAWSHGYALDCGCFGGGGEIALQDAVARYPWDIARDVGLLLLAVWLVVRPHSRYALDDRLFPDPDVIAPAEPDTAEEDL